jgi:hypothetical protein
MAWTTDRMRSMEISRRRGLRKLVRKQKHVSIERRKLVDAPEVITGRLGAQVPAAGRVLAAAKDGAVDGQG